ncbi:E3 ubiquitin-protein ligase UPL7 [Auxenochlorella protothecoides]|uniref:HECT-type E3 ubiquitin transferase n=1 Tax=Auxenochlorella protothecoides TaxID=3075 RepID=A0A087SH60_AUXPR|nr:E3 ubiquitin-protein ligase UPL7 [Auxenochlorella protothecoides]KFM25064.1 E3 ubiquitin-protein ligase UPL7 [Auxenochlorella protothecoides]
MEGAPYASKVIGWVVVWLQLYAPVVADTGRVLDKDDLLGNVLPPILAASLLPFRGFQAGLTAGAPIHVDASVRPALRGSLALVLRSLASAVPAENLLSTAPGTPSAHRLCHLLLLCCSLAGCPGADGLTQAAATRCARLLLAAPTSWALDVAKDHAANAAQALHAELVRRSLRAVPAGVARLAAPGNAADRGASRSVELLRAWLSSLTSAGLAHEQADCAMDEVCLAVLAKPGTGDEGSESETAALFVPAATQAAVYAAAARVAPLLAPPNALYLALVLGRAARAASRSLRAGPFLAATSVLFRHACGPGRDGASARALLGGSGCPYSRGDLFGIVLARLETQDVEALGTLCHAVLTLEAEGARTVGPSGDTGHNQTSHTPLLNHLAFNPGHQTLLSTLWRHLAHSVPLLLEAHRASSRGWDVPSLARGARASLTWGQARCWGVLCRLLRHLLGALDDAEFAAGADGLSPEGRRALTAALNTMVLYERDARCAFCPACLWLEPFQSSRGAGEALASPSTLRALLGLDVSPIEGGLPGTRFTVRRAFLLEDGMAALLRLDAAALKARCAVTFVDALGREEAGIDAGGLQKEFLECFVAAGVDPRRGLFSAVPGTGAVYPNPLAAQLEGGWLALEALGSALGKALYEGLLLDAPLAPFFLRRLQGHVPQLEDLIALDPGVHRSLLLVKQYDGDTLDSMSLDFTAETEVFGRRVGEELVPGGANVPVTLANRLLYVHSMAHWHLSRRLGPAAGAFARGFQKVFPTAWLRLFSASEFNQLLGGGGGGPVDVADLRRHTVYSGGYTDSSSTIKAFWACVAGMDATSQAALLKFVTSVSRPPLGGFQHLAPPFAIHKVACSASPLAILGGRDVDRLPTASTCTNTLKLPDFRRSGTLREKLLYAIRAGAGFDLS